MQVQQLLKTHNENVSLAAETPLSEGVPEGKTKLEKGEGKKPKRGDKKTQ